MTGPTPFQPVGEQARWRTLVEHFSTIDRGSVVSFDFMEELLGMTGGDRGAIRSAVRQAASVLSKEHDRSLVSVRGVGYRVVLPDEHLDLAARQQRKAGKALARGKNHVDHVDLAALSPLGRRLVEVAAQAFAYQQGELRRLDLRQRDLEASMASVTKRIERTESETSARLAKLEEQIANMS